ncbi:MAG TPA: hypothetical protein ENI65_04310 [Gammaproteobacteria bacterium]|nr:hypothetical protein [Gammaproteobacteria bacterium]
MNNIFCKYFLFILAFAMPVSQVSAERFLGDPKDAFAIENLVKVLMVQYQQLEKLMAMLDKLDSWKKSLDRESTSLTREGELAKSDRTKLDNGQMTEDELNRKWHKSGRALKHESALKLFSEDIVKFNRFVETYNQLTKKMKHILEKRTPGKVTLLVGNMKKLVQKLQDSLKKGNIEKAKFIARQSAIAGEFGYKAR